MRPVLWVWIFLTAGGCSADSTGGVSTIQLVLKAEIGGVGDSIDLVRYIAPAISSNGMIAAAREHVPSIVVYDSSGRFVKLVSRPGDGPGELSRVGSLGFGPGDSLWVLDGV